MTTCRYSGAEFIENYPTKVFVKLTNISEKHRGIKYHTGLNNDPLPFDDSKSCSAGGMYFTTTDDAHHWIKFGMFGTYWVRIVTILPDSVIAEENDGIGFKAKTNKFYLSSPYSIFDRKNPIFWQVFPKLLTKFIYDDPDMSKFMTKLCEELTFKCLEKCLVTHHENEYVPLNLAFNPKLFRKCYKYLNSYPNKLNIDIHSHWYKGACAAGCLDIIESLHDKFPEMSEACIKIAIFYNRLDIIRFLLKSNQSDYETTMCLAAACDRDEIIKYFIEELKFDDRHIIVKSMSEAVKHKSTHVMMYYVLSRDRILGELSKKT
jgi:hypothetical protein